MSDRDVLIRTIIGEAANEGADGWAAVAHVVRNRAMDSRWPNSVRAVSLQDKQFSAWNEGAGGNDLVSKYKPGDPIYERVGAVVDKVMAGQMPDNTGGATHYYSPAGMDALVNEGSQGNRIPRWLQQETDRRGGGTVRIGGHIFTGRKNGTPDDIVASANNDVLYSGGGDSSLAGGGADDALSSLDPDQVRRIYDAYTQDKMSPQQRADYEADVRSGRMSVPTGVDLFQDVNAQVISGLDTQKVYDAFLNGKMTPEQQQDYIADVESGAISAPASATQLRYWLESLRQMTPMPDMPGRTVPEPAPRDPLDLTRSAAADAGGNLAMSAMGSLAGNNPSPSGFENPLARVPADAGLAILGGLGAAGGAAAGAIGDAAVGLGMSPNSAGRLTRDLSAIPEAVAGSPLAMAGNVRRTATQGAREIDVPADKAVISDTLQEGQPVRPLSQSDAENLRPLIADAAKNNRRARQRLADMAEVNPDAMAAADRAGFEVPADIFADNEQVQQAIGAVRSVRSSDAATEWAQTLDNATTRAAEILADEGAMPISTASDNVQDALTQSVASLRDEAGEIYNQVSRSIPASTRIQSPKALQLLRQQEEAVGGRENMRPSMRRLLQSLESENGVTYGFLQQERRDIGGAAFKQGSIYADADENALQNLYAALGEDQVSFVRSEAGDAAADQMLDANRLWSSARDLEKGMVSAFGKDMEGSIAQKLKSAITGASRGDAGRLNRILNVVPENLQREAVLSALDEVVTTQKTGNFSAAQFASTYRGLRDNPSIYAKISDVLGSDTSNLLRDVYEVSVRLDRASQRVSQTGASNQAILFADGMMGSILNSSAGRLVRGGVVNAATAPFDPTMGMFSGAAAVSAGGKKLGRDKARAVGNLFRNDQFQSMMRDGMRNGRPSERSIAAVQKSPAYRRWARVSGVPDTWLLETIARATAVPEEQ